MSNQFGDWPKRWIRRIVSVKEASAASLLPWTISRVITLLALAFARTEVSTHRRGDKRAIGAARDGLLSSDAAWYRSIASYGYQFSHESLRFFPLLPALTRLLHDITQIPMGGSLLLISNFSAFLGSMLIYLLVKREIGNTAVARRAVWLFSLAPPAFVLVMGYSESLFILLAVAAFLCIRSDRWWWACLWGFLAGMTRPIGFLLFLPVLIEVLRSWRAVEEQSRLSKCLATIAPILGLLAFLSWVAIEFGGFFTPLKLQRYELPKSISDDPFVNLYRDSRSALEGTHIGTSLHLPWIVISIVLCVVVFRKLPSSYGAFAAAVVMAGLLGANFASFERYAFTAFPLVIGAATLLRSRRVEISVFVLCGIGLFGYALLAFLGLNIP